MFVIQLKDNWWDKILGTKYNNTKNWKLSEVNLQKLELYLKAHTTVKQLMC